MRTGGDLAGDRIGGIDPQRLCALRIRGQGIAMCEHKPRHSIGQRRLADTLRPPDQPGMRDPSAAVGVQQRLLGFVVPR
jgi:hypothetical protein